MSQRRILVIDDSEDMCDLLQALLEDAGYDAKAVKDGQAGLEATRAFRPDLIITDISMPGMNGFDFLVRLRSDFAPPLPSVIVCSGFDMNADEALRLGAACFVAKPIEPRAFLSIVGQVLEGRTPDAPTIEQERTFARQAGARAAEIAARMMAGLAQRNPDLQGIFTRVAQRMSDYFEIAPACITILEGDVLKAIAVSRNCSIPAGAKLSSPQHFSTSMLAAKSSLVLPDARAFGPVSLEGQASPLVIGFLVAAPLVVEDVPIGAFLLVGREPHSFSSEDLGILEGAGRMAADKLQEEMPLERIGLWPTWLFDRVLAAEMSLLHRERGGLDLLLVDIDPKAVCSDTVFALLARGGRSRLSICYRGVGTLAISKRDRNAAVATSAMANLLSAILCADTQRAVGWISVIDHGLPPVPSELLLQLAVCALDQARSNPNRPTERIVVSVMPPPLEGRMEAA